MTAQGFRPGDVASPAGVMRLTVGGLAEIAARCDAPDCGRFTSALLWRG